MNELQIKVETSGEKPMVDGRSLHAALKVETPYRIWFPRMTEYGFEDGVDFVTVNNSVRREDGTLMPQTQADHQITIGMAKELCMIQRNEKGKLARQYFIQLEKDWNSPEKVMARALQIAERKIKNLEDKALADKPKVLFADAVSASHTSILVGDLAKLLRQNGVDIGQNRLFKFLREKGYLCGGGERYNLPTQRSMDREWFQVKETTINQPDGSIRVTRTVKVTGKGQQYFINLFLAGA